MDEQKDQSAMTCNAQNSVFTESCQPFVSQFPTAEALGKALKGTKVGGQWLARCPAHGDKRPSLSIRQGKNGKPILHCFTGCDFRDIQDALKGMGLWPEFRPGEMGRQSAPNPVDAEEEGPTPDELRRRELSYQFWAYADPWLSGTPAETYLKRRGVWNAVDPANTPLRFARLMHPQTREKEVPCIIVPRHDTQSGAVLGSQRIFLTEEGSKYPRKPFVDVGGSEVVSDAKLSLGSFPDAWAMLHTQDRVTVETIERWLPADPTLLPRGHDPFELSDAICPKRIVEEVEHFTVTDTLVLAEGVETALSAALMFDRPAWAKCSGFPLSIILPECVQDVLICADNDTPIKNGKKRVTSEERATALAKFIRSTGRHCEVVVPGDVGMDMNDVLMAKKEAA